MIDLPSQTTINTTTAQEAITMSLTDHIVVILSGTPRSSDICDLTYYRRDPETGYYWRPLDAIEELGRDYGTQYETIEMRHVPEEWHYCMEGARLLRMYADAIVVTDTKGARHLCEIADWIDWLVEQEEAA